MQDNNTDKVHEFLTHHHMGVLSTVSKDGQPWGSAIMFAIDDDLNFYFMTRADTLKYQNIAANPNVALTVTDEASQITVQASGTVKPVEAEDIINVVFQKLDKLKPYSDSKWVAPVYKVHEGDYMILHFTPTKLQYADFKQVELDAQSSNIEQII